MTKFEVVDNSYAVRESIGIIEAEDENIARRQLVWLTQFCRIPKDFDKCGPCETIQPNDFLLEMLAREYVRSELRLKEVRKDIEPEGFNWIGNLNTWWLVPEL